MARSFTLAEANALLPEVERRLTALRAVVDELRQEIAAHPVPHGADGFRGAAAFRLNLSAHRRLGWFRTAGVQIKGLAPFLVDFPAVAGGREVLLCWREGEAAVGWYHDLGAGYAGRRPVSDLGL